MAIILDDTLQTTGWAGKWYIHSSRSTFLLYPSPNYGKANEIHTLYRIAGRWLVRKARLQAAEQGTYQAARNLRKQGAPLNVALAILGRETS